MNGTVEDERREEDGKPAAVTSSVTSSAGRLIPSNQQS